MSLIEQGTEPHRKKDCFQVVWFSPCCRVRSCNLEKAITYLIPLVALKIKIRAQVILEPDRAFFVWSKNYLAPLFFPSFLCLLYKALRSARLPARGRRRRRRRRRRHLFRPACLSVLSLSYNGRRSSQTFTKRLPSAVTVLIHILTYLPVPILPKKVSL